MGVVIKTYIGNRILLFYLMSSKFCQIEKVKKTFEDLLFKRKSLYYNDGGLENKLFMYKYSRIVTQPLTLIKLLVR